MTTGINDTFTISKTTTDKYIILCGAREDTNTAVYYDDAAKVRELLSTIADNEETFDITVKIIDKTGEFMHIKNKQIQHYK